MNVLLLDSNVILVIFLDDPEWADWSVCVLANAICHSTLYIERGIMARAKMITMNQQEEDLIHEMSIKCLNEIGVCIHSEKVLKMLEEIGGSDKTIGMSKSFCETSTTDSTTIFASVYPII